MSAYYNEIDTYAAQWLRNLIACGLIAPGDVDTRSIEDVRPDDLRGYTQCHFFAGIGIWSAALRRAGWPDDRRVWTASCPCQPFSAAGAGLGFDDERHLWPALHWLIAQCQPPSIFGEQVASKAVEPWIDLVHADLEGLGYAFGCVPFPSAGVGAPHIRDRAYWMADANMPDEKGFEFIGIPLESKQKTGRRGFSDNWETDAIIRCADGRSRPIRSSIQPLANGDTDRVGRMLADQERIGAIPERKDQGHRAGRLRAYGNAINLEAATVFIQSTL